MEEEHDNNTENAKLNNNEYRNGYNDGKLEGSKKSKENGFNDGIKVRIF